MTSNLSLSPHDLYPRLAILAKVDVDLARAWANGNETIPMRECDRLALAYARTIGLVGPGDWPDAASADLAMRLAAR